MLMSAFLVRFRANYVEKMHCYPQCFFVDSYSPFKDLLFPHGLDLASNIGPSLTLKWSIVSFSREYREKIVLQVNPALTTNTPV